MVPKEVSSVAIDATEPRTIIVHGESVAGAQVRDHNHCPLARALKAEPDVKDAFVKTYRVWLVLEDDRVIKYLLPPSARRAVHGFDVTAGNFPEGTYELLPIPLGERRGVRQKRRRTYVGSVAETSRQRPYRPRKTIRLR